MIGLRGVFRCLHASNENNDLFTNILINCYLKIWIDTFYQRERTKILLLSLLDSETNVLVQRPFYLLVLMWIISNCTISWSGFIMSIFRSFVCSVSCLRRWRFISDISLHWLLPSGGVSKWTGLLFTSFAYRLLAPGIQKYQS